MQQEVYQFYGHIASTSGGRECTFQLFDSEEVHAAGLDSTAHRLIQHRHVATYVENPHEIKTWDALLQTAFEITCGTLPDEQYPVVFASLARLKVPDRLVPSTETKSTLDKPIYHSFKTRIIVRGVAGIFTEYTDVKLVLDPAGANILFNSSGLLRKLGIPRSMPLADHSIQVESGQAAIIDNIRGRYMIWMDLPPLTVLDDLSHSCGGHPGTNTPIYSIQS